MSQVDEFVKDKMLTFPSIFPNRSEVLHHVLCVLGSGYKWSENGTVVPAHDEVYDYWNREDALAKIEKYVTELSSEDFIQEIVRKAHLERLEEEAVVVAEIDERVHLTADVAHFYRQTDYSLLTNIPANVTPDWAEACEEMKELAVKAGWEF
jgi:hypothetical protein